jgi:DNA helicase II / ATP-dependent DNA helicase PcrA
MHNIDNLPEISTLDSIETNFKVYAGPGAGKTTWLTGHLESVLRNSNRLGKTGRIACITYTNVAVEEISNNLKCDKSRFDISTIHSFLYSNIVKPFSYLIKVKETGDALFNINDMDGHSEHIVYGDRLRRWVTTISERNKKKYDYLLWPDNKENVIQELSSLDYYFSDGNVDLIIRQHRGAGIPKANSELWIYKDKFWQDGIMHHEDVLYFAYYILCKSPRILEFIRAKYQYIFIDEFQDTTELQTWILNKICSTETTVGVVGDLAQSIYKFAGANRNDFIEFQNGLMKEYKLKYNHRSTKRITDFLNLLRTDIKQAYPDYIEEGEPMCVLIGDVKASQQWFNRMHPNEQLHILTKTNKCVTIIKNQVEIINENLLKTMYEKDSNSSRPRLIHAILSAYQYHKKNDWKNSLKAIVALLKFADKHRSLDLTIRKIAIEIIEGLNTHLNESIYEYYISTRLKVKTLYGFDIGPDLRKGTAKEFYQEYSIQQVLPFVNIDTKSNELIRTIHSAKGTGFKNVMVHFELLSDFKKYILRCAAYIDDPDDDARIYYVGCSRAMKTLIINIPEATGDDKAQIISMNLAYEIV